MSFCLDDFLFHYAQDHPSDGWGGFAVSVSTLDAASKLNPTWDEVENSLKHLHAAGLVYLQRWDWSLMKFRGFDPDIDADWFAGTFRLLPERP